MKKTLEKHLLAIKEKGKTLVVPYIMAGDGGLDKLEEQLLLLESTGVSTIEIGLPFSDPVADGPVIQAAGLRALQAGTTTAQVLKTLKTSKIQIPLVIMTYFNPIFHYGLEQFVADLKQTPVKGLIIPDLPYEHQAYLKPLLEETDISLIPLLSLTSPRDRMAKIAEEAEGFIYAVTVNGTTGARTEFGDKIDEHLRYLEQVASVPVLAGFGVSKIDHVERFAADCDGVIVGSKIVNLLAEDRLTELKKFLKDAVEVSLQTS